MEQCIGVTSPPGDSSEVVLPRIQSDLFDLFEGVANQTLDQKEFSLTPQTAATVMLVSGGYPEAYEKGKAISGLDQVEGSITFHAGTKIENGTKVHNRIVPQQNKTTND